MNLVKTRLGYPGAKLNPDEMIGGCVEENGRWVGFIVEADACIDTTNCVDVTIHRFPLALLLNPPEQERYYEQEMARVAAEGNRQLSRISNGRAGLRLVERCGA